MPFRSEKQRRFMFANHPQIAKRWAHEYGLSSLIKKPKRRRKRARR